MYKIDIKDENNIETMPWCLIRGTEHIDRDTSMTYDEIKKGLAEYTKRITILEGYL